MKIPTIRIILAATVLSAASATVSAEAPAEPVTAALAGETRAALIKEMQAIAAAMGRIHTAVVTGDHATVHKEAGNIRDSFILKQALSDAQRKEIGAKLPAGRFTNWLPASPKPANSMTPAWNDCGFRK